MTARSLSSPIAEPLADKSAMARLLEIPAFAYSPESERLFLEALRESAAIHCRRSPHFGGLWKNAGFSPEDLRGPADITRMPFIFVAAFKERELSSIAKKELALELTSSGTSGQKSRMLLDKASLLRVRRMAWQVFAALGMADRTVAADYLCFTYDPKAAKNLGTAFTDELLTGLTKTGETFYALRWSREKNSFYFDMDGALSALERFEKRGRQARLVGFPAHALALCEAFKKSRGRCARLNPSSWVLTGGGWKDQQDRALDKGKMRRLLAGRLGLKTERVRDMFGMVEHGVPYMDCPLGKFHVPVYGKIIVRHPAALEPLPYGETGLLQFITPYLSSYPSISLLSSDFGWLEEKCSCGLKGPVLHIAGRGGVKKLKGCAISASTLL
ncbi:MAG: hypothetical protein PHP45_00275 [Elusimicrobiales bacterium]|nr:hypothetical protein [Elusimicrobiales bacterium]